MNVIIVKNAIDVTNKFTDCLNKLKENKMSIYVNDFLMDNDNNSLHVWGMLVNLNSETVKVFVK
jgi:hypothetical protein